MEGRGKKLWGIAYNEHEGKHQEHLERGGRTKRGTEGYESKGKRSGVAGGSEKERKTGDYETEGKEEQ